MHKNGVSSTPVNNSSRVGHHKRTSDLVSDAAASNTVLHRKGISTTSEAQHSSSSAAAAQRKSISNLNECGEYISNSTHSADRKSISSMHRSANMSSQDSRSSVQVKRDGQSTLVERSGGGGGGRDSLRVGEGGMHGGGGVETRFTRSEAAAGQRVVQVSHVERVVRRGNASSFVLDDGSSYRREFTAHVHGPCPAAGIESPKTPFKHTRDTREHKFYKTKITH